MKTTDFTFITDATNIKVTSRMTPWVCQSSRPLYVDPHLSRPLMDVAVVKAIKHTTDNKVPRPSQQPQTPHAVVETVMDTMDLSVIQVITDTTAIMAKVNKRPLYVHVMYIGIAIEYSVIEVK
jgi:hypothetical protein